MSEQQATNTGVSADQLKEILSTVIAAVKAPSVLEQRQIDAEERRVKEDQENRLKVSKDVLFDIEQKRAVQLICSHEHPDGTSHGVWIQERTGPGYILCQYNQCKVRPGVAPAGFKGTDIYDTALFNRMFQKLPGSNTDMMG